MKKLLLSFGFLVGLTGSSYAQPAAPPTAATRFSLSQACPSISAQHGDVRLENRMSINPQTGSYPSPIYTATTVAADCGAMIWFTLTATGQTYTLPTAVVLQGAYPVQTTPPIVAGAGWYVNLQNDPTSTYNLQIVRAAAATYTINGATLINLAPGSGVTLIYDGANWQTTGGTGDISYVYTIVGQNQQYLVSANVQSADIIALGGGGGGGGGNKTDGTVATPGGGGGGSGATKYARLTRAQLMSLRTLASNTAIAVQVGGGGTGGTGASGTAATNTGGLTQAGTLATSGTAGGQSVVGPTSTQILFAGAGGGGGGATTAGGAGGGGGGGRVASASYNGATPVAGSPSGGNAGASGGAGMGNASSTTIYAIIPIFGTGGGAGGSLTGSAGYTPGWNGFCTAAGGGGGGISTTGGGTAYAGGAGGSSYIARSYDGQAGGANTGANGTAAFSAALNGEYMFIGSCVQTGSGPGGGGSGVGGNNGGNGGDASLVPGIGGGGGGSCLDTSGLATPGPACTPGNGGAGGGGMVIIWEHNR
jgi:hypothetical protein